MLIRCKGQPSPLILRKSSGIGKSLIFVPDIEAATSWIWHLTLVAVKLG